MNGKRLFCLNIVFFVVISVMQPVKCWAITAEELIEKCQKAESAIRDVSVEYEWHIIPPPTLEEVKEGMDNVQASVAKDGFIKFKLSAARFFGSSDVNSVLSPYRWRVLSEESTTIIAEKGACWNDWTKESYDGQTYKKTNVGGWPTLIQSGLISARSWEDLRMKVKMSPIGFSIFRFELDGDNVMLSALLRQRALKDSLRMGSPVEKVGDFNTICVELLLQIESRKVPIRRIYFSIQHNYTPVKYEYFDPTKEGVRLWRTVEVQSLQSVGNGLWFPSSGIIQNEDSPRADVFQVIGKILVNQGLTEKDFDVEFPVGTRVTDQVRNVEYVVKAPKD